MNTAWSIRSAQAPPRAAFGQLLKTEWLTMRRERRGLIFGVGLPVLLIVIFGFIPSFRHVQKSTLDGLSVLDVYLPILVTMVLTNLALFNLPPILTGYREAGILRRLSITPLPPSWVLAVQLILNFCVAVVSVGILLVIGIAAFGLNPPQNPGAFLLVCLMTILVLFPLGLMVSAIARSSRGATQMGAAILYPSLFFAGLWFPQQLMPTALRDISRVTPLGAAVQALTSAVQGPFPPVSSLLVIAGWAIVFSFLAVHYFKWE